MDFHQSQHYSSKLVDDLKFDRQHSFHKHPDKDPDTGYERMHDSKDNQNWRHILDGNPRMDFQSNSIGTDKNLHHFARDILH